ncbi:MAG: glycosyltransferase [Dehalococcoidia bacterium]
MYGTLALRPSSLDDHTAIAGEEAVAEIRRLAEPLRGLRVLHLSVTAFGTGVAELLNAAVPLTCDVGLDCAWQVVRPAEESAAANKALYRALAGGDSGWSPALADAWLRSSAANAEQLTESFDVVVVHDPQPAAIRSFVTQDARTNCRWVFHSHLDFSEAEPGAWALLREHLDGYDAIAFDAHSFVHPDLRTTPVTIIRPAIDPLGPRNMDLDAGAIEALLRRYSIDAERPLLLQMSPCDPGSDLLGAIDVANLVRRETPGLQLALIAMNPPQDPASISYFGDAVRKSMDYPDVHILRGVSEVGNVEANAFQRASNVVIQKGLRRGFGIWISDAQWKNRPVVTAKSGGLEQQVIDGETGFFANTTDDFAGRVSQLLNDREVAERLGRAGHKHVAENFLLTRFLADELRFLTQLTGAGQ